MNWFVPDHLAVFPAAYMAVAAFAMLLTGVTKGGFGGVGILAVPLMMMVASAEWVLGT